MSSPRLILVQDVMLRGVHPSSLPDHAEMFSGLDGWAAPAQAAAAEGRGVIAFCALGVARRIGALRPDVAVWGDDPCLSVSGFSGIVPGDLRLNRTGIWLPFGEIESRMAQIRLLYPGGKLFIRPDGAGKAFPGMTVHVSDLKAELSSLRQVFGVGGDLLTFIDRERKFARTELRFWVAGGRIVTWAPYAHEGLPSRPDPRIVDMAACVAQEAGRLMENRVDMIVADVATATNDARLIEVNGFSTSGIYAGADVRAIFEAARSATV